MTNFVFVFTKIPKNWQRGAPARIDLAHRHLEALCGHFGGEMIVLKFPFNMKKSSKTLAGMRQTRPQLVLSPSQSVHILGGEGEFPWQLSGGRP